MYWIISHVQVQNKYELFLHFIHFFFFFFFFLLFFFFHCSMGFRIIKQFVINRSVLRISKNVKNEKYVENLQGKKSNAHTEDNSNQHKQSAGEQGMSVKINIRHIGVFLSIIHVN